MFEGFNPTPKSIEIIRDYLADNITLGQLIEKQKEKPMRESYEYIDPGY
jgi:hypothetical protein